MKSYLFNLEIYSKIRDKYFINLMKRNLNKTHIVLHKLEAQKILIINWNLFRIV